VLPRLGPIASVLALLLPSLGEAAPKTDILILGNGDRITCEIKSLYRDQLTAKTDSIGTITVKWGRVSELTSTRRFSVETSQGFRFVGSLRSVGPRRVTVVSGDVDLVTLDLDAIVLIRSVSMAWYGEIDGNLDLGFSYTRGSGVAQASLDFSATFRRPTLETTFDLNGIFTRTNDTSESSRSSLRVGHFRYLSERWIWGVTGEGQRNTDLGIKLRGLVGVGAGYRLVRTNRQDFLTIAGVNFNREIPFEGDSTSNVEASLRATYGYFLVSFPKTNVDIDAELLPSLTDGGRVRFELNASVRRELWHDFSIAASLYDSYDNRPPGGSVLTNDVGVTLSVGWSF
jgi:hypothetical protein